MGQHLSPRDIISGALEYYDVARRADRRRVTNQRDGNASTLLMAHVEYWEDPMLPAVLSEVLTLA